MNKRPYENSAAYEREKALSRNLYPSSTPYYIQELERKIDRLEYKLDLILAVLESKDK